MININKIIVLLISVLFCFEGSSQYNQNAGKNRAYKKVEMEVPVLDKEGIESVDEDGIVITEIQEVEVEVEKDSFGNADGNNFDLAQDGAFSGNTIAILNLYRMDLTNVKRAVAEKGFSVVSWNSAPSPDALRDSLQKASQLWVISGISLTLREGHAEVISDFFDTGKGLYIWGDNDPCIADANFLLKHIFGTTMAGSIYGDQTVGISGESENRQGVVDGHLISTGVVNIYEGITVATVTATQELSPLVYGSEDNLVAAVYEKDGKRAIIDGGFTRLYYKWNTAGTGRYVKNAAAWLVNYERFGDDVYSNVQIETKEEENEESELDQGDVLNGKLEDVDLKINFFGNEQISSTNYKGIIIE